MTEPHFPGTRGASRRPEALRVPSPPSPAARLSIGALSRATGIPVETLRTWEHRYGFPEPERKPSGHRVYATSIVLRLRRIAQALARGHRASEAVPASDAQLSDLLVTTPAAPATVPPVPAPADMDVEALLAAVSAFDADTLRQHLLADWARLGPLEFLQQRVSPLLRAVGVRWSEGALDVRHEHFVSERLGDLLRMLRRPFEERSEGPLVVFTTLPGETHALGLQMAALTVATAGCRVMFLGTETPVPEIAALARDVDARAIALSASVASRGPALRRQLAHVRERLPSHVGLVVGGEGAPRAHPGAEIVRSLPELLDWARRLQRL